MQIPARGFRIQALLAGMCGMQVDGGMRMRMWMEVLEELLIRYRNRSMAMRFLRPGAHTTRTALVRGQHLWGLPLFRVLSFGFQESPLVNSR